MNINFGMDNFYVRYLKRFLNSEFRQTNTILGEFDKDDQAFLIDYLNTPNVETLAVVQKEINKRFPRLNTLFVRQVKNDEVIWTSREISNESAEYLISISNDLRNYCKSVGWYISDMYNWVDNSMDIDSDGSVTQRDRQIMYDIVYNKATYPSNVMSKADINLDGYINEDDLKLLDNYLVNGNLRLIIKKENRKNFFPNKDMLVFVNQFDGTFLYNYAILDGGAGTDNVVHPNNSNTYKIALYKCKPNQKITIAHNNTRNTRLVIGSSNMRLKQDIVNNHLSNVVDITLNPRRKL